MAYGLKYELLCTSKKGNLYTAKILEDGYTDADIDRNVPINPFSLRKDRAAVVKGTSLEFQIREETDFEFISFYTSNPKKYLIELYKASTLLWTGYLDPQQYSAPYKPAPNNITFRASDGMGLLKDEEFTLTGRQSELDIIIHCLDKIGLDIGFATAISIWEANHDTSKSPLEQSYLNCEIFDENNCYEVLEKVLGRYDAEISQWNGRWQIISSIDKKTTRMLYTSAGVYEDTEAAPDVLDLGHPNEGADVYPVEILTHSLEPGGNKTALTYDYGLRESMLVNYLFTKYSADMFTDWSKTGSFDVEQGFKDGVFFAWLRGYANSDNYYISQQLAIKNVTGQQFVFEVEACPYAAHWAGSSFGYTSINITIRIMVSLLVGSTTYYLTTDGWGTTPGYVEATIASARWWSEIIWTKIGVMTYEIPGDGTLTIRLQRISANPSPGNEGDYIGALFKKPLIYYLENNELYDDKLEGTAVFDESVELRPLADIEFAAGDAPDVLNNELLYDNCVFLSDDTPTTGWKLSNNDTMYTLLQAYLKLLASRNRVPRQVLSGRIKGTEIGLNSIIKHAYNSDREFEIAECTWDLYEEVFSATLLEVLAYADQDITYTDEDGTVTQIDDPANLTVASVTHAGTPVAASASFNITVHIDNTGSLPGQNTIQWKVVNESDETQTSGTHASQTIAASDDDDDTFAITAPDSVGTYTVKCKMINDTAWVSSASLTVSETEVAINSIAVVPVGVINTPLSLTFNATNSGPAGTKTIYYELYDSDDQLVYSGDEDKLFANGTDNYSLTETVYPSVAAIGYYFLVWSEDDPGGAVQSNDFEATAT